MPLADASRTTSQPDVSVVVPTLREAENISPLIEQVASVLDSADLT